MRTILLIILSLSLGLAQKSPDVLNQANFNKMIELYGQNSISVTLPPLHTLDSLRHRPFVWADGYRIQVFAGSNYDNALLEMSRLQKAVKDSVYLEKDGSLYRLQFGDYVDRIIAETRVDSMRKYGWPEAWIVSRKIRKFIDKESTPVTPPNPVAEKSESSTATLVRYGVQLGAYSSLEAANKDLLKFQRWFSNAYVKPIGRFYKILAGSFIHRNEAEILLESAREKGFTEAWVTSFNE